MTDPVSEELERRAHLGWPWRSSLLAALMLHLTVAVGLLVAPSLRRRPLSFPAVQVRLGVVAPAPPPARPSAATARAAEAPPAPKRAAAPSVPKHPIPEPRQRRSTRAAAPAATPIPSAAPAAEPGASGGGETGEARSPSGAIAIGGGAGSTDESFPYSYYLTRLLGMIEANWFKPPVPAGTRCRVLCRVDRGGRLLEAGIEEPSPIPAFDRAALRAVYASAPFPPLPQGFSGATLTIHLEFGP